MTGPVTGRGRTAPAALAALVIALPLLGGCAQDDVADGEGTIALLLPEAQTARYETSDRPTFEEVTALRCPTCTVLYANADQDAATQQEQAESMISRGADVLVIDAVDTVAAKSIVADAERHDVPVIAYDRFIDDERVDYYVSFDSEQIGYQQGLTLRTALAASPPRADGDPHGVLLVHGSPTDPNSTRLKSGVHRALDSADVEILAEYDTPDWSPDKAQSWVEGQLTQFAGRVDAVYAANDGTAGGAIAAMKAAGMDPVPPTTGQDAELAAVQRIVAGDQLMTVAKATDQQARTAAELAVRVLRGEDALAPARIGSVKAFLLAPTAIVAEDVERVIVQGRVHTVDEICTTPYAEACAALGLTEEDPS
ncbi:ABC transporter substrate-binding protein [Paraoerskovia sediminicola]|uniref:ABC transporter substrate-binding protein n=1 Tax=Paraoerskovia sediminicola TaxID=1138587 RepID=A0ABM8G300_9CELL|nr:substrate-binding domain-containing protein [Paraoerskovia sediminicola]BDZ42381.1 ABC transporter substrate-binding protein [Paraoerskovia sediminicola]